MAGSAARNRNPIRFGTSGWRGVLGEEVTFPRLRQLVRATARWLDTAGPDRRVLVGYDTRFASRAMAEEAAAVLLEQGYRPTLVRRAVPTPVLTHAIHRRRMAGGLMLTASHNPPEYHGLKVFGPKGDAISDRDARRIESLVRASTEAGESASATAARYRSIDLADAYVRNLVRLLDRDRLAAARIGVVYDAMHGSGAGVLDRVLAELGCRVVPIRSAVDPHFDGGAPDPVAHRLGPLVEALGRRKGRWLGLATDGDADRLAVVLPGGRILRETEVVALLVDHLARSGRLRRGVAVSLATGSVVERVASAHGLTVVRRPIGFKHLAGSLLSRESDVAGDESGGFAWSRMGVDKDGLLAGALLCELAATQRGGVARRLADLESRFGRSACGRRAVAVSRDLELAFEVLSAEPPERVGTAVVSQATGQDGLRLELPDGFVMWRRSGTEPVVRIYAEAAGPRRLERRLAEAERLLGAAAGRAR